MLTISKGITPVYSNREGLLYYFIGNKSLIEQAPIAVFCSREIPLSIYNTANETFSQMLTLPLVIGGGWQSAMEKRVLINYMKESQARIIYFLARGINHFKIPGHLSHLIDCGKLLMVSPLLNGPRIGKRLVGQRDDLIFNLVDRFFFLYIKPEGYLESLFTRCLNAGKEVYLLEHKANSEHFIDKVKTLSLKNLKELSI